MVLVANFEKNLQKNRFKRNPKLPKLDFGDFGLITKNEGRLELIQLSFFKKIIKTFVKKKKAIWMLLEKKFDISEDLIF